MKNIKYPFWWIVFLGIGIILVTGYYILHTNKSLFVWGGNDTSSTCIDCHGTMAGFSPHHAELACVSCHFGDNTQSIADSAHINMLAIPGNLANAQQACGLCHAEAVTNINASLMTTNSGIIAVDKYVFGEYSSPDVVTHINDVHHSPADEHLRALCLRCHLGSEKTAFGPIDELSRGGGCNACHLNYTDEAKAELTTYLGQQELPTVHPSLDLQITDDHCFGCHSRSGRIATNYQGFHETLLKKEDIASTDGYKVLMDDRVFKYVQKDIHHERGLACIDCHGADEVMGDGKTYLHEEEAIKVGCEDCHTPEFKHTAKPGSLPLMQQRIYKLRKYTSEDKEVLLTQKDSIALINTYLVSPTEARLVGKLSGQEYTLRAPAASCTREFGHDDLTCSACHTGWAPQCIGCHVSYEPEAQGYDLLAKGPMTGSWVEYAGGFLYGPPTLGVRERDNIKAIEPAIPGMIMTLDKYSFANDNQLPTDEFHRLFAPAAPHTTTAKGRACTSCHNEPLALGYGRGKLDFNQQTRKWTFTAEYEDLPADGLPADAWTGFLQEPAGKVSTRLNFRPFTIAEQQRILTVGTCLTCHDDNSEVMKASLHSNFADYLNTISQDCLLPVY